MPALSRVSLTVDGQPIEVGQGTTLLEAAREVGLDIPHLCHLPGLPPRVVCRLCLVRVVGQQALVPSCSSCAEPGQQVQVESDELRELRRGVLELIIEEHGSCGDPGCEIEALAARAGVRPGPTWPVATSELGSDYLVVRPELCVYCDRCIRACDLQLITRKGRGSRVTMGFGQGGPLDDTACTGCGDCAAACPAGAIRERDPLTWQRVGDWLGWG